MPAVYKNWTRKGWFGFPYSVHELNEVVDVGHSVVRPSYEVELLECLRFSRLNKIISIAYIHIINIE